MSEPGSRLQASVLTFGPVGRVITTLVLLAVPAWFLLYGGLFGLVGVVTWVGWVLPRALRDTWRRAALPSTELTRLRDEAARQAQDERRARADHPAFDQDQPPPSRW
ncbi:MAG TPA: hypothetical protein VM097_12360 [Mycobacteriales bacterium]|nr:hypothetical protein [Mycobacteriales bacterium]